MRYKLLGRSGLRVSELGLGTMTFMEDLSWGTTREQSWKVFDAFAEAGGNFLDTSNSYGTSESYLGEMVKADRDRFVIATKYSGSAPGEHVNSSGNHRKSLVASVAASTRRLQTDHIDLLWLGAWDFLTPVEETMRALDDLVRLGTVLYVGICNTPAWYIACANTMALLRGWSPFAAVQLLYNVLQRDSERELLPMARTLDIGAVAWTPLASGWLTGKYSGEAHGTEPRRLDDPIASRFVPRTDRAVAVAAEVVRVADEIGCRPVHVALSWFRHKRVVPLVGARTAEQVRENVRCLDVTLTDEQVAELDRAGAVSLGYPHDFLAAAMVKEHTYGGWFADIDDHRGLTALLRSPATGRRDRGE